MSPHAGNSKPYRLSGNAPKQIVTQLLFHPPGVSSLSPFDDAIVQIANCQHIKLVSPYIGLRYLKRLIGLSKSWVLISDIEAWLSALSRKERELAGEFIQTNLTHIHHFPAIHAKTVIGPTKAYLGSANLTTTGVLSRTELGVLVNDPSMVAGLHKWFDELWLCTAPPVIAETKEFSRWLDSLPSTGHDAGSAKSLSFDGQRVHARMADAALNPIHTTDANTDLHHTFSPEALHTRVTTVDLEVTVSQLIEKLATKGFELHQVMHELQGQRDFAAIRAVYTELSFYCANIPISVFSLDTVNRLIVSSSHVYRQSTAEQLKIHLTPYDTYLENIIDSLSFEIHRPLPDSCWLTESTGITSSNQRRLIKSLKEANFLKNTIGEIDTLENYTLNEGFQWSARFQLFTRAHKKWILRLTKKSAHIRPAPDIRASDNVNTPSPQATTASTELYASPDGDEPTIFSLVNMGAESYESRANAHDKRVNDRSSISEVLDTLESLSSSTPSIAVQPHNVARVPAPRRELSTKDTIEIRVDKIYLNFSMLLEQTSGKLPFKTSQDLAKKISDSCQEHPEFIHRVLLGKDNNFPKLFDIPASLSKNVSIFPVIPANATRYPITFSFMLDSAKSSDGYFAKTTGYYALLSMSNGAYQKRFTKNSMQLEADRLIADKIFEALIILYKKHGGLLPYKNKEALHKTIHSITSVSADSVKKTLTGMGQVPRIFTIKPEGSTGIQIRMHGNGINDLDGLPRTKAILDGFSRTELTELRYGH